MKWIYGLVAAVAALLLVRESLLLTRSRRTRRARAGAGAPVEPPDLRTRIARWLFWPIFVMLMALVALAAMVTAILAGPH